jgi:hypothetical protein
MSEREKAIMTSPLIRPLFPVAVVIACLACALLPSAAQAFANVGAAPVAGSPGLPDGRVYEEVSPANKNGNPAGTPGNGSVPTIVAEAGGEGVAFNALGSIGETKNGFQFMDVAKRGGETWVSYGAQPRALGPNGQTALNLQPTQIGFSTDLTKVLFRSNDTYLREVRSRTPLLYDIPTGLVTWLAPPPATPGSGIIAGFSSDMSTAYFWIEGPMGFYEWHDGVESPAGVLPNGSVEPGALPAGSLGAEADFWQSGLHGQVSEDGTRAFFVSRAHELYVRETAADGSQRTVLVSRDTVLPLVGGEAAAAPHGVLEITFPEETAHGEELSGGAIAGENDSLSYGDAYASPDGSRVFFASEDQLTTAAPQGGGMYEFNTGTETLTYLPGVGVSPILVSSHDGSRFLFNGPSGVSLWSEEGGSGGRVTPIGPYPVGGEAQATPDGSVFAFESAAPFAGFNNGGSHINGYGEGPFRNQEVYRYDVAKNSLSCVSCPPAGVTPSSNAYMGHDHPKSILRDGLLIDGENRALSVDGSRVFFDSSDPLVSQDVNTAPLEYRPGEEEPYFERGRDVYEWENGRVYLVSTGTSSQNSYVGDESEDGNDVFFSTAQGLSPGDTDETYDVYDARVPRPGDHAPPPPAPCEGDVCQGPPSVYMLLEAPASATFSGLGNPMQASSGIVATRVLPARKTAKCRRGLVKRRGRCVKGNVRRSRVEGSKRGRR